MIRILHTSDWHIGRLFYERSLVEDQSHVLQQIIDLAVKEKPDAVVIAGDIYDRAIPPVEGIRCLDWVLSELVLKAQVPVFVISGNHDSGERLGFGARLLSGSRLRVVSSLKDMLEPMVLEDTHGKVELFGIPYCDPSGVRVEAQVDEIQNHEESMSWCVQRIAAVRRHPSIAVAHAYVAGGEGADSERPLSIGGKPYVQANSFSGFCYTALGHLHGRQTFEGGRVHYSGSLLPYHFSERDAPKSVSLVELDANRLPKITSIPLSPLRRLVLRSGTYDELVRQAELEPLPHDFVMVRRRYDGPRPDLLPRLRQYYPHLMHVETLQADRGSSDARLREPASRAMNTQELFAGFYRKVAQDPMSDLQTRRLIEKLKETQ